MQGKVRRLLIHIVGYVELVLAFVLLVAILLAAVGLVMQMGVFHGDPFNFEDFGTFLNSVFALVIGIEFIRMLVRHTPGAVIEVLLFAIARQLIVEHAGHWEMLIGIVCIAGVFAVRKFLFTKNFAGGEMHIFHASKPVQAVNRIARTLLPDRDGGTLGELAERRMRERGNSIEEGATAHFGDTTIRVATMREGRIETLDVYNAEE